MTWTNILSSSPVVIALTVAVGVGGCRAAGVDPHLPQAVTAAAVAAVASVAAMVPLVVVRRQPWTPTGPAQAALLSMVAHLGMTIMMAAATLVATRGGSAFAGWMLALYWTTLISTAAMCIRAVRLPSPMAAGGTV